MIINELVTGIIAIVAGYLLGSIPTAYTVTRIFRRQDIRKLGGGNVGGLNTFREVGLPAAACVAIVDLGKGVATVAIAFWVLQLPTLFVLLAGLAAVVGHNWMIWLKFSGGKGMAPTIGAVSFLLVVYGYWPGLLIFLGVIVAILVITRNISLSMAGCLIALPFITSLGMKSTLGTVLAVILGILILIKFYPTAKQSWLMSKSVKDFIFDRGRRDSR